MSISARYIKSQQEAADNPAIDKVTDAAESDADAESDAESDS